MIEANGDDKNGGIFSLDAGFTLLNCPPKDKKPTLLKKFGNWDENVENLMKYPVHSVSKNGVFITSSSDVRYFLIRTLFIRIYKTCFYLKINFLLRKLQCFY